MEAKQAIARAVQALNEPVGRRGAAYRLTNLIWRRLVMTRFLFLAVFALFLAGCHEEKAGPTPLDTTGTPAPTTNPAPELPTAPNNP